MCVQNKSRAHPLCMHRQEKNRQKLFYNLMCLWIILRISKCCENRECFVSIVCFRLDRKQTSKIECLNYWLNWLLTRKEQRTVLLIYCFTLKFISSVFFGFKTTPDSKTYHEKHAAINSYKWLHKWPQHQQWILRNGGSANLSIHFGISWRRSSWWVSHQKNTTFN